MTITVSSEREISDLGVSLSYYPNVSIEGIEYWEENLLHPVIANGLASWGVSIGANQTIEFSRTLYIPPREGGHFPFTVTITDKSSFHATNALTIVTTSLGDTVYLANTPILDTPRRLWTVAPDVLETLQAMPTTTPWSTLTPRPTHTPTPTPTITPTPWVYPPPWDEPGENPYP